MCLQIHCMCWKLGQGTRHCICIVTVLCPYHVHIYVTHDMNQHIIMAGGADQYPQFNSSYNYNSELVVGYPVLMKLSVRNTVNAQSIV